MHPIFAYIGPGGKKDQLQQARYIPPGIEPVQTQKTHGPGQDQRRQNPLVAHPGGQ